MLRRLVCLAGCLATLGCTSLQSLVTTLHQSQIPSCLYFEGYVHGTTLGQGIGSFRGLAATGGARVEQCTSLTPPERSGEPGEERYGRARTD